MRNARSAVSARSFGLAGAAYLLLAGCSLASVSADVTLGGSAMPAVAPTPGPANPHDGIYTGAADVVVNGDLKCPSPMPITNFRVDGNVVRFGGFRAAIGADGSIGQTPFRGMWLSGRFDGAKFTGMLNADHDVIALLEGCIYAINVTRPQA